MYSPKTGDNGRKENTKACDGDGGCKESEAADINEWILESKLDPFLIKFIVATERLIALLAQAHGFFFFLGQKPSCFR